MIKNGSVYGLAFIAFIVVLLLGVYLPNIDSSIDIGSIIISLLGG